MVVLNESEWLPNTFAKVRCLSDVVTEPLEPLLSLSAADLCKIRNTQALKGDIVRVLGISKNFCFIMKADKSLGWIMQNFLEINTQINNFSSPPVDLVSPTDFLARFKNTPYLCGGLTEGGVDCSGLTQRFYYDVHGIVIPRNSREQRKISIEKPLINVKDHDLVFGVDRQNGGHHAAIFFTSKIWHSDATEGVVAHSRERFEELFKIEAVVSVV